MIIEKNPSLDCSWLPVVTPSIVTLMVFWGSPLKVDPRGPPVVSTPGSIAAKYNALRDVSGSSEICSTLIVDATVDDWVWMTSLPALTSTVSLSAPTSSVTLIDAGVAVSTRTGLITAVLNP